MDPELLKKHSNTKYFIVAGIVLVLGVLGLTYLFLFTAPQGSAENERFVITLSHDEGETIDRLAEENFIKSKWAFNLALTLKGVIDFEPGAYRLSKSMNVWEMAEVLDGEPYMKWIVVPEGLRKEEIAELLANGLGWAEEQKAQWIEINIKDSQDYAEGVYFPDTYLISIEEAPEEVSQRFINRFEEIFVPIAEEAKVQNIRWPTLLKIASLVQREAASEEDMPLIAGILWNRLLSDMRLDIDATLQYIKGEKDDWWPEVRPEDKRIDSPFNTYMYTGLPPRPIANPGLAAMEAVLFPEETTCLFYLHDAEGSTYCSETYEEHVANIEKYL